MARKCSANVTVCAAAQEAYYIKQLNRLFHTGTSQPKLVGGNGEEILLPESVYQALRQVVSALADGQAVSLVPQDREMTTQEAADLLNVSRPYLIKLLEQGDIPYICVGSHRRIRSQDLIDYKNKRNVGRRTKIRELTEFLQEEGFYSYGVEDSDAEQ